MKTYLVTGALGCIGAWVLYHLTKQEAKVISFDVSDTSHRIDLLLSAKEQTNITFVRGDLSDPLQVLDTFHKHKITHVLHLAALQVPFCRASPTKGAQVNVVGTINVFEAAKQTDIAHIAYASSIAVYGPPGDYPPGPITNNALFAPRTLYGTYKQANEAGAQVYWQDYQISSTALRPHTVYGIGRDQGLTSDPTKAMLAAVLGQSFTINFSSKVQLQLASDVALQFIEAAEKPLNGAFGFNMGGDACDAPRIIEKIRKIRPDANINFIERVLPFPETFDDSELRSHFSNAYYTSLDDGIQKTMDHFEKVKHDPRFERALTL